MQTANPRAHWDNVYATKRENEVSWFQEKASLSLDLVRAAGARPGSAIIDIGGGASRLVDALIDEGFTDLSVLDVADAALSATKARLGANAGSVHWITADITRWRPPRQYDLWHDRAAFHFLTEANDRAAYVERLTQALAPGAHAIIATFAPDGPERCSGLPVVRYDAASLGATLGSRFALLQTRREDHRTPFATMQRFQYSLFRRG
jgi:trans-aconitate methyltransferase